MPKLIFTLLGKYNITTGSADQSIQLPQLPKLLLVHFLFNRHRWHTREDITEQFWPDYTPRKAASNLTSTLTRLHQALPAEFRPLIQTCGTNTLMLSNEVDLWIDAEEFEAEASLVDTALNEDAADRLRNALGLYHGDLLPGWDEEWILIERERLRYLFVISLRRLMGFYEETGALERAVACGQRVLKFEPLHEATHEALMQIYLQTGFRAAALKQYETCRRLLKTQLGVEPNDRLRELYGKALNPGPRRRLRSSRSLMTPVLERSGSAD